MQSNNLNFQIALQQEIESEIFISEDDLENQSQRNSYFICSICFGIVINPVDCSSCEKCYCQKCIDVWLINKKTCPSCQTYFKSKKMHNALKNMLHEITIICPLKCSQSALPYEKMIIHLAKKCPLSTVKCPFNCGGTFQRGMFEKHCQECPNSDFICKICKQNISSSELNSHNCIPKLLEILSIKEQKILYLEAENSQMKYQLKDLQTKQKNVGIQQNEMEQIFNNIIRNQIKVIQSINPQYNANKQISNYLKQQASQNIVACYQPCQRFRCRNCDYICYFNFYCGDILTCVNCKTIKQRICQECKSYK